MRGAWSVWRSVSWAVVLSGIGPWAAAAQSLGLGEAVERALVTHPSQVTAAMGVERAAAAQREADAQRWPALSLEAGATRFAEPMVVAPLHGFDPMAPPTFDRTLVQGNVGLTWSLFDASRRGRTERAAALRSAAQSQANGARDGLIAQVVAAYVTVRATRELVAAHDARVSALERERERAVQLFEGGRAARVVVLRADATLSSARADRVGASAELDVAERVLERLVGLEAGTLAARAMDGVSLTAGARALDRTALIARAQAQNPELARARWQVEAAQASRAEARGMWLPRLQLAGRYIEYASGAGREAGEWQGGLQLSYPLFTGGARGAAGDRAEAELTSARAEVALAELRVADDVDRAIAQYTAAGGRVAALQAAVAQSEEVVRIERLALDSGAGVQTDYLDAEAELLRNRAALTRARQAELTARIELARTTGDLDVAWLMVNVESEQ